MKFHQKDEDPTALLDLDLWRLHYGKNQAYGEEKNARYVRALKRFVDEHEKHPLAARALHEWASVRHGEGESVKAHEIASRGLKLHPDSVGGRRCYNLIQNIEAKSVSVQTERTWNKTRPK